MAEPKPSCEFRADAATNLLRLWYRGHVTVSAMRTLVEQAPDLVKQFRAGFTILVDLSGLQEMDLECVTPVTRLMDICQKAGVGTVIRVIPDHDKDIGLNILSLTHYRHGVRIVTCDTTEEAERTLDS